MTLWSAQKYPVTGEGKEGTEFAVDEGQSGNTENCGRLDGVTVPNKKRSFSASLPIITWQNLSLPPSSPAPTIQGQ